ncbi:phytoene desaturase family protein [Chitinispirillales bacterium ANBcel5]|uniref:phytoene desaturase family protein n=1 Tax=Cellulosispirillum alkaliphilum TaxID=3039283 RepID=UPI002A5315E0|nr:phytoene desaturase family protein [Chitinispirillales bacterium ANBcel5]
MGKKHICVIGAGPGGLSAAMLLSYKGYRVTLLEKASRVGGRNSGFELGKYHFDAGPTFLMMSFILKELFHEAGRNIEDYLDLIKLSPMYKLNFPDVILHTSQDKIKLQEEINHFFPGNEHSIARFFKRESSRYDHMYPCLQKPYSKFSAFLSKDFIRAIPHLSLTRSLYALLSTYFNNEHLRVAFTFQSKYLGMSPWECPGAFSIIPYIEYAYGIDHVKGGLHRISHAMEKVAREEGADIRLSTPVKKIITDTKTRTVGGVVLENGESVQADAVVIGSDFGYSMQSLFEDGFLKKWKPSVLRDKKRFSCSTFMLYLGLNKLYNEPHHQIIFSKDYKDNLDRIVKHQKLGNDYSFYVRNASITDSTLAPKGHSALYVLVPVSNRKDLLEWDENEKAEFRKQTLEIIKKRTSMTDIEKHIVQEKIVTPADWEARYNVFLGATFNLGHNLRQMLYFRPRNSFEEAKRCYLVGGGTHPGSGLPTIFESARITSKLIEKQIPL